MRPRLERDLDTDARAEARCRVNRQLASDQVEPLSHADQSQTGATVDGLNIEAVSIVRYTEHEVITLPRQIDGGRRGVAMLDDVPQGFLRDPECRDAHHSL